VEGVKDHFVEDSTTERKPRKVKGTNLDWVENGKINPIQCVAVIDSGHYVL
jgi:hypothetical protein